MEPIDRSLLVSRIQRLERNNRLLGISFVAVIALAAVGWQTKDDTLRVKRLEVVDDRGVPLVILSPDRLNEGGMITLRDRDGEKRAWWQAGVGTSSLTLNSQGEDTGDSTLGLSVGPNSSGLSLLSKGGACLSVAMQGNRPAINLYDAKGKSLFGAPWNSGRD